MNTSLLKKEQTLLWPASATSLQEDFLTLEVPPRILVYPHPSLKKSCDSCISDAEHIILALTTALLDPQGNGFLGVGLSANQIGINARVCIVRFGDYHFDLVNPKIVSHSSTRRGSTEMCLSIPDYKTTVMRWEEIVVYADTYKQPLIIENFDVARIIQHEIEHLDGLTLLDHKPIGRNEKCSCGSNLKFKKCCGAKS